MNTKKIASGISATILGATALVGAGLATATPASAMTCGYSIINEQTPKSGLNWDLPIVGNVDLGGGNQTITTSHYGNCSGANEQLVVHTKDGDKNICVTPGDTRLGISAESNGKITGAEGKGHCK